MINRHHATVLHEIVLSNTACHDAGWRAVFDGSGAVAACAHEAASLAEARAAARAQVNARIAALEDELDIQRTRILALDAAEELPEEMTIDELLALGPDDAWWFYCEDGYAEPDEGTPLTDGRHNRENMSRDREDGWHDFTTEAACRAHHRVTTARRKLEELDKGGA